MSTAYSAQIVTLPLPASVQRVTGTSSQANATALDVGVWYTISNAGRDIRYRVGPTAPTAVATDLLLQTGREKDFLCDANSRFVAGIDSTGAAASIEFHVYPSGLAK